MSESFEVHIAKAEHVFSAAHFITFAGHCERLHGHNYHVSVEVAAPMDENHLVIDFLLVRSKLLEITTYLDHYMLLPTGHPQIQVADDGREIRVKFEDRRWVFPTADCRILPVPNTTSEMLASYIGKRLYDGVGGAAAKIKRLRVSVDECDGQTGVWKWKAD